MRYRFLVFVFAFGVFGYSSFAQSEAKLSVTVPSTGELVIVIQSEFHKQFGVACPLTYKIDVPVGSSSLKVMEKHASADNWSQIIEKSSSDIFNKIEAVRFDYSNDNAYVSAAFSGISDTLYLKILDSNNNPVSINYKGITKYYDNRQAAVTVTFDDWEDWNAPRVPPLVHLFTSHGLYLTGGIITGSCSGSTWRQIQAEVDSGYVEAASHSRTHPATPYSDPSGEVNGSYDDILNHIILPSPYNVGGKEYIYTWIAPYGDYDSTVDSLLEISGYLAPRVYANLDTTSPRIYVYGDSTLSAWDSSRNHFKPFFPTVELGAPSWGGGDTSLVSLDSLFDVVVAKGDVYHCMWHPQVIISDINKRYLNDHIDYISGRKNIWYVNLGILYLYHLVQMENSSGTTTGIASSAKIPSTFRLLQNYPNPFNPTTTITYSLAEKSNVKLTIYDILGRQIQTLFEGQQNSGTHTYRFNASNLSSGIYFYTMEANDGERTYKDVKKMILLK